MTAEKTNVQMMLESVGLFSKAGHMSGVKYPALKFKSQLLSGVRPTVKVDLIGLPQGVKIKTRKPQAEIDELIKQEKAQVKSDEKKLKEAETSAAFAGQTRAQWESAKARKDRIPPVGAYNCSFSLVEQRVLTPNMQEKAKTRRRKSVERDPDHFLSCSPLVERHLPSPISFSKQIKRPDITTLSMDVNESRFQKFNDMPGVNSKYRKVATPDIARIRPRRASTKRETRPSFNTYQVSYKLVQSDLGKVGAEFAKQSPRKPNIIEHIHDLDYEKVNFTQVEKRVPSPDLQRKIPRPSCDQSDLPFFMRNIVSRMSLNTIRDKGLEMNNFAERGYATVTSSLSVSSPHKPRSSRASPRLSFATSPSPTRLRSLNCSIAC